MGDSRRHVLIFPVLLAAVTVATNQGVAAEDDVAAKPRLVQVTEEEVAPIPDMPNGPRRSEAFPGEWIVGGGGWLPCPEGQHIVFPAGSRGPRVYVTVDGRKRTAPPSAAVGVGNEGVGNEDAVKQPPPPKHARTGGKKRGGSGKKSRRGGSEPKDDSPKSVAADLIPVDIAEEVEWTSAADDNRDLDLAAKGGGWACRQCTLLNRATESVCEVCGARRGSTRGKNGGRSAPPANGGDVEGSGDDVSKSLEMPATSTKRTKKPRRREKNESDRDDGTDQSSERRDIGMVGQGSAKDEDSYSLKDDVSEANYDEQKKSVATKLDFAVAKDCGAPDEAGDLKLGPSDGPNGVHLGECTTAVAQLSLLLFFRLFKSTDNQP